MKRYYLLLFLLIVVLLAGAKKKVTNLQPLWPDGSVMSEWFNDTAKIDVKTLGKQYVITKFGVKNDPTILQTAKIQAVIDRCANEGGGVVVIPRGTFLTGALFFQKGTHLHFEDEAVLKGIDDIRHYPLIRMHMEGQMIDYFAALVTVQNADGFTITGKGTIDGNGLRFWEEFWIRRKWNKKCTNLEALRPQLVYISDSKNVTVQDVQLINSPFWTNHLYRCERVRYIDCHIESPTFGDYHAPSSDAIDLDVCDDVVVRGCYMNICDDAVCLKGGKGTYVDRDSTAGAVNRVLVEQCRFGNHVNAAVTFGSEAWNCHNVIMRNCQMEDAHRVLLFKMRPDTPQQYGDVLVENCTGTTRHSAIETSTWTQFYNKQERKDMPVSSVRNVSVRNLDIKTANFFKVDMKQSFTLNDFTLENINVMDKHNCYQIDKVENLKVKNVVLNSKQINK
jgi:polygalacturonase